MYHYKRGLNWVLWQGQGLLTTHWIPQWGQVNICRKKWISVIYGYGSNSETKRDIRMDPTDGPELSRRKRAVSRKQIFSGWVQRESCSRGCTGEVICPLKEIVILKQKWLLSPNINIFWSKLYTFVPSGLSGFLICGYQNFWSHSKKIGCLAQ